MAQRIISPAPLVVELENTGFTADTDNVAESQKHSSEVSSKQELETVSLGAREERKLLRRIDWRLLPLLAAMYVVKTIDAQNVGNC